MIHNRVAFIQQFFIVAYYTSALSAADCLACLKTEASHIADKAKKLALIFRKDCLACILNNLQVVFFAIAIIRSILQGCPII